MRKRLFEIIEVSNEDKVSRCYDVFMMISIIVSIVPLWTHSTNYVLQIIDLITVFIFIIDYVLRLITADFKLKKGIRSFFIYPFTGMAIKTN